MKQAQSKRVVRAVDALAAVADGLAEIPADEVVPPPMPVDKLIGEGLALAFSAKEHADELLAAGLDEALLDDLRVRVQALADA